MLSPIFSISGYAATGLSTVTVATAAIVVTIAVFVFSRGVRSPAKPLFLVVSLIAATWLAALSLSYASESAEVALVWARAAQLPIALLPAAVLSLAAVTTASQPVSRTAMYAAWIISSATGIVAATTSLVIPAVTRRPWGYHGIAGGGILITSLVWAALYATSIIVLWSALRRGEGESSSRAGILLLALVLGGVGFLDLLPAFGIEVYPVAYIAVLAFTIVAGASIGRYDDVDLTPQYAASQILETMKSAVILVDMEGKIRVVNRAAFLLLGYSPRDLIGQPMRKIFDPDENTSTRRILNSTGVLEQAMGWINAAGARVDVLTSSSFVRGADGVPVGVVYVASDYTERRRAEQRLRESEARYRLLFERNLAGVYRTSVDGEVLDCNDAFARIFGYESRVEMLRHTAPSLYFETDDREHILRLLREQRSIMNHEARMRRKDGTPVWVLENMTLLDTGTAEPAIIEGTIIDVTDRKYAHERIEYHAYHDLLTSLPNRLLFRDRLSLALAHARRMNRVIAVMFLDLDDFKAVNDTLGHTAGDRLLQAIASRLAQSVRAEDTVARMGGDEFTILLPDVGDGRGASTVARKIIDLVAEPITIDDHVIHMTPSVGIALFPGDGFDAEALLRSADRAMYCAKQLGRNNYQYATPPPFDDRATVQRRLSEALERSEFLLHYQPIVEISSGQISCVEALLRWNDPREGLRHPGSFMSEAEDADVMLPLGEWVLRTACAEVRRWRDDGQPALRVAVNLSARQFQNRELASTVSRVLEEIGLPAAALELEISETVAMSNPEQSLLTMRALKQIGVGIAIDDFGTGYSSLRYLRRLPIDTVKVHEELVRDIAIDSGDRAAMTAVISMARALRLRVVAEGVEAAEELEFLRREGCTHMQGFLYSRPLPPQELRALFDAPMPAARAGGLSPADA